MEMNTPALSVRAELGQNLFQILVVAPMDYMMEYAMTKIIKLGIKDNEDIEDAEEFFDLLVEQFFREWDAEEEE